MIPFKASVLIFFSWKIFSSVLKALLSVTLDSCFQLCIYPNELGLNDGALKYLPRAIPKAASKDVSIEFLTNYGGDVDVGKQAFPYLLFDEITITSLH